MPRITPVVLNKAGQVLEDLDLLKVLRSEIKHELSFIPFQSKKGGSWGEFAVDWDSSQSQDVVLRRKYDSGEEVAISALLGPETLGTGSAFPREVRMKVCVRKPGLNSLLQFDCGVKEKNVGESQFAIHNAYYLQSIACSRRSAYRGPLFSTLDPHLQSALKDYLVAMGINEGLTRFLLLHLHKKEQGQYVNWLQKLESFVGKGD
ncbi:hypothetical protein K2173_022161 [Erythroxylum novogranatense]|uniref:Mitochondrial glycoprotein n=1 Tax=Erythroxylum novogranatense TaxID=1862640 RepID=A0AAV8STI8_9ROSI|nr:hypothetical protein K2173_022161 [Erythroxylum novogranatense]